MIKGFSDKSIIRRSGKIRSGRKEGNRLINTDTFLLHDAPGLGASLGSEEPTEIYFTVHTDNMAEFLRDDLRWYTKNELVCRSMHDAPDANGVPMGYAAAFFSLGDHQGVSQIPFPRVARARIRSCMYQACPNYVKGECSEHMFLDVMVPQHSMGAVFTFDNTSIKAIQNAYSAFQLASIRYGSKLSGQIFRAFKIDDEGSYTNDAGKTIKTKIKVLQFESIDFGWYEANFKDKIKPDDWNALVAMRGRVAMMNSAYMLPPPSDEAPVASLAAPSASAVTAPVQPQQDNDAAVKARANDPAALPVFEEATKWLGGENTEDRRIATARNFADVGQMVNYLQKKIADAKKAATAKANAPDSGAQKMNQQTKAQPPKPATQQAPPPQADGPAKPVNAEVLY